MSNMAEFIEIGSTDAQSRTTPAARSASGSPTIVWLQGLTLGWMTIECGASLLAAAQARSPAALAFGSDSLVEMVSATLVLAQFIPSVSTRPQQLNRIAAGLLFALAGVVVVIATVALFRGSRPDVSPLGIGITAAALVIMPVLAWLKRRQANRTRNSVLAADAIQSATCAWLAAATLAGLVANWLFHAAWLDPLAALIAVPVLMREGLGTWRGQICSCCE
jgi:divalent metal cation (Fe/Co/Zn/Cd) transporter